jgi:hypothetical protein
MSLHTVPSLDELAADPSKAHQLPADLAAVLLDAVGGRFPLTAAFE